MLSHTVKPGLKHERHSHAVVFHFFYFYITSVVVLTIFLFVFPLSLAFSGPMVIYKITKEKKIAQSKKYRHNQTSDNVGVSINQVMVRQLTQFLVKNVVQELICLTTEVPLY